MICGIVGWRASTDGRSKRLVLIMKLITLIDHESKFSSEITVIPRGQLRFWVYDDEQTL